MTQPTRWLVSSLHGLHLPFLPDRTLARLAACLLLALGSTLVDIRAQMLRPPPGEGFMPNECCPDPAVGVRTEPAGDEQSVFLDAGEGPTRISTFGSAERQIPMPPIEDGMQGLARLYHGMLKVNVSYPAWQEEPTGASLYGGGIPVPNLAASVLGEEENAVQPRPGTMPGLYLYFDDATEWFYHYGSPLECGANPQTTAIYKPIE